MKTKISRIGKKSLSVIITIIMIVSTMLVGMVSASAFDVSSPQTIYFKPSSAWSSSSYFGLRVKWGDNDTEENFYMMSLVSGETDIYTVEFPTGTPKGFQFVKFNSNNANRENVSDNGWDSYQTSLDTSKNLYIMGTGWSVYSGGSGETTDYYYSYNNDGSNKFVKMETDSKYGGYFIRVNKTNGYLNDEKKFKIADVDNDRDGKLNNGTHCVNYNIETTNVEKSTSLTSVSFEFDSVWRDLYIKGTSPDDFYIQYTPGGNNGLAGTIKVWSVTDYEGITDPTDPTEPTTTEPVETTVPPTTVPVGDYTITDTTELNGSLSFSAEGRTAGRANKGDTVTITGKPAYSYFELDTVTVTGADKTNIEVSVTGNTRTFTMPAQNVTATATFKLNKSDYIKSLNEDGLWIDVAPDKYDTTATLIKWNNYSGSNHGTSNPYTFYVPKNVELSKANIYNGYGNAVILNETSIPADDKAEVSLAKDASYTTTGGVSTTVKVMQGSTNAMFLHTTNNTGADYDLPTKIDDTLTSKSKVETSGGSCTTMVYDGTTSTVSSAMALDTVKGRGNSSWEASYKFFGKYAFNMKLASKTKLFGMDNSKSWCLLANNADESMMRNALTYQLAAEIGIQDSPEFRFVDIYDNGEYLGAYLITEKVDVGNSKLVKGKSFEDINEDGAKAEGATGVSENLTPSTYTYTYQNGTTYTPEMRYAQVSPKSDTSDESKYPYKTKGKYLLEFEIKKRYTAESSYFTSPQGQHVVVKSPEFATKQQVEYIAKKFAAMEEIAFTSGATHAQLSTVMDVESFAKMYLIQELSSNLDSAATSYYVTFDCAQSDPVFVANPVWDYDWAYGQYSNTAKKAVNGDTLKTDEPTGCWVAKIKSYDDGEITPYNYSLQSQLANNNSEFKSVIRKVWEEKGGFYENIQKYYTGEKSQIDEWYDQIAASVDMNETRWGIIAEDVLQSNQWGSKDTGDTHADAVNYLENTWTAARAEWLNKQFTTTEEYKAYTPDAPTIKLYAADGKTETSAVEQGTGFIIKVTSPLENNVVYRFLKSDGSLVDSAQSDGILEIATDGLTVGETYTYKVQAVYNGKASGDSNTVSVTIDDKAGNKQVTIYFKSASASAYVPSLSIDGAAAAEMTRDKKSTGSDGTYFGSTYSGSLKFYWFYTKMKLDTSVEHTLKFTTKDNRVNASTSYKFVASEGNKYYFAVDNLMGDTNLINLTGLDEYIRNYHISATHMVYSATSDRNIGFTWINGKEWAMGTYIKDHVNTASLTDLTSSSLLTIPSALTPNAMLEASSAPAFFTIKSATLAQRISAEAEEVSTLQYQLLDVNLDGKVDVKDSTMMQKALAGF